VKFIKRIPPADQELTEKLLAEGWKKLKEPSNVGMAILLSVPFMFINGIITMAIIYYLSSPLKHNLNSDSFSFTITIDLITILYIFLFMLLHELVKSI